MFKPVPVRQLSIKNVVTCDTLLGILGSTLLTDKPCGRVLVFPCDVGYRVLLTILTQFLDHSLPFSLVFIALDIDCSASFSSGASHGSPEKECLHHTALDVAG